MTSDDATIKPPLRPPSRASQSPQARPQLRTTSTPLPLQPASVTLHFLRSTTTENKNNSTIRVDCCQGLRPPQQSNTLQTLPTAEVPFNVKVVIAGSFLRGQLASKTPSASLLTPKNIILRSADTNDTTINRDDRKR